MAASWSSRCGDVSGRIFLALGGGAEHVRAEVVAGDSGDRLNRQDKSRRHRPESFDPLIDRLRRHSDQPGETSLTTLYFRYSLLDGVHAISKARL